MVEIGYKLSSEEQSPQNLVTYARRAEDAGFTFAMISDHFHPWIDRQGESPFVWSVLGGIAQTTERLRVATGVTCPTIRTHPAIIAHAAATTAAMMEGRFILGVGTGENLNEHIVGRGWPPADVRREMLDEAIQIMRLLWQGGLQDFRGRYYTVTNARLYTLPQQAPPIFVAAGGPLAAELAGRLGDGLISTGPERELIARFEKAGGTGKPRWVEMGVCWAADERKARRIAHEWWPISGLPGNLYTELPLPQHFQDLAELVTEDAVAEDVVCGPDPERHLEAIEEHVKAGFDHICVHQIGDDQEGFFRFYEREVLPKVRGRRTGRKAAA